MDAQQHHDLLIALTRIQTTQEQILARMDRDDEHRETLADRIAHMETKINYAAGAVAVSGVFFIICIDWFKQKVLGIS